MEVKTYIAIYSCRLLVEDWIELSNFDYGLASFPLSHFFEEDVCKGTKYTFYPDFLCLPGDTEMKMSTDDVVGGSFFL